jgi:hypothetical protein
VELRVAEAVLLTGLSGDLLYDQMRSGKLAYLKVGRRRVITRTSAEPESRPSGRRPHVHVSESGRRMRTLQGN